MEKRASVLYNGNVLLMEHAELSVIKRFNNLIQGKYAVLNTSLVAKEALYAYYSISDISFLAPFTLYDVVDEAFTK